MVKKIYSLMNAIDSFLEKMTPKFSYNSFIEFLGDYFDRYILNHNNYSKCVGGICKLNADDEFLYVSAEIFFKDSNN